MLIGAFLLSISCRNSKRTETVSPQATLQKKAASDSSKNVTHVMTPGEQAYRKSCLTCHQANGSGVPGMYPALSLAEKVKGPPEEIAKVVLFGLKGPVVVNGQTYTQNMPPFKTLPDSTIALVVNFVKQRWGGSESALTASDVRRIRAAHKP